MSTALGRSPVARPRWLRALTFVLALVITGGLTTAVSAGTASAQNTSCLNYPGSSYTLRFDNPYYDPGDGTPGSGVWRTFHFPDGHTHAHVVLTFWIRSVTPTFNVAAQAFVDNNTNETAMGTFSTTQSKTFTISETTTTGVSTTLLGTTFSASVSNTVTSSISTSTTIQASAPVPPHSRVNGDFGVDAYIVNYDVDYWQWDQNTCWYHDSHRGVTANVPTTRQGWHLYPAVPI